MGKKSNSKTNGQVFKSLSAWVFPLVAILFWYQIRVWDLLYFVSSAEIKMLMVPGSRAWRAGFMTPCQGSILLTALQSQVLACGLPLPFQWPQRFFALPWHFFDTRQSMFLLCLVIPGRSKSSLPKDCSDCSASGVPLLPAAHEHKSSCF